MARKPKEHDLKGIFRPYHFQILKKVELFTKDFLTENTAIFGPKIPTKILCKKVQLFPKSEKHMI